jgi:hypothetical protein
MAEQSQPLTGVKVEPGQVFQGWAVYRVDDAGKLLGIVHACLSELEARATSSLGEDEDGSVKVEAVVLIVDKELRPHVLGPSVKVMTRADVDDWVREQAKKKLGDDLVELLGIK